ncbi:MAG: hypothetical protein AB7T49_13390 [Oligoflexales bacterium]
MKLVNVWTVLCPLLLAGCGTTKKTYEGKPGTNKEPAPYVEQPTDYQVPEAPPVQEPAQTPQPEANVEETIDPSVDQDGVPYNPEADIPYEEEYADEGFQYDADSFEYFDEMDNIGGGFESPYEHFSRNDGRPYLSDRYRQQRSFLNQENRFRHANFNDGRIDRDDIERVSKKFRRSRKWVNQDIFNEAERTCEKLERKDFRGRKNLVEGVRNAIRKRDHRKVAELNDALLDEADRAGRGRRD